MIEEYKKLVAGFVHEANEPMAVFKQKDTYVVHVHNVDWDNHSIIMVHIPTKTIPYNMPCRSLRSAKALFTKLAAGNI